MSAPETEAREALIKALQETFAAEKPPVVGGKLHTSRGDGQLEIGVYPERTHHAKDALINEMFLGVQIFDSWERRIDVASTADPTKIEGYVQRFREKLKANIDPRTSAVWYFMLERVDFLPDPTSGITRAEAHLCARGNNPALLETK